MHRIDSNGALGGMFNDNLALQSPATRVSAAWLNDVQENLAAVIESQDIELDKGEPGQLLAAIMAMFDAIVPIGAKIELDGPNTSASLLELDTEYLRADYPRLVAFYSDQDRLIAGSTGAKFRTPDYEGLFSRAASTDATVDPDGPRGPGDGVQQSANKSHSHVVSLQPLNSNTDGGSGRVATGGEGVEGVIPDFDTGPSGGAESRPVNVALRWLIRGR